MNNRCPSAVFFISFLCLGDDMLEIFFKDFFKVKFMMEKFVNIFNLHMYA